MATETPVRSSRKERVGIVISDRMQKTIVVRIAGLVQHQAYGRVLRRAVSCKAHDEQRAAHVGDTVRIVETRPLSKDKHWRLVEVLKRAPQQTLADVADPPAAEPAQPPQPVQTKTMPKTKPAPKTKTA